MVKPNEEPIENLEFIHENFKDLEEAKEIFQEEPEGVVHIEEQKQELREGDLEENVGANKPTFGVTVKLTEERHLIKMDKALPKPLVNALNWTQTKLMAPQPTVSIKEYLHPPTVAIKEDLHPLRPPVTSSDLQ